MNPRRPTTSRFWRVGIPGSGEPTASARIPDLFNSHIEDVADRFAGAGYVAVAPDLYSAGGGRPPALAAERSYSGVSAVR